MMMMMMINGASNFIIIISFNITLVYNNQFFVSLTEEFLKSFYNTLNIIYYFVSRA